MRLLSDAIPSTWVYLLAHLRRGPYYIDVASDHDAIEQRVKTLLRQRQNMCGDGPVLDPAMLVWHEVCDSEAAARARAAEIRAWPQRWQRRLIESQNPHWLEQGGLLMGMPFNCYRIVPETTPKVRADVEFGSHPEEMQRTFEAQGQQWREAAAARATPPPVMQRHRIPVHAGGILAPVVCDDLWSHGMVVLDCPKQVAVAIADVANRRFRRAAAELGVVLYADFKVPGYGAMHYLSNIIDIGAKVIRIEHALVAAATRLWAAAGRPARYGANLEVETATRMAYPAAAHDRLDAGQVSGREGRGNGA